MTHGLAGVQAKVYSGERVGGYIRLRHGGKFYPHDPRPEDIDIKDIAYALARINRYGGHTSEPYSVAEHCIIGALFILGSKPYGRPVHVTFRESLAFLLHDAAEAYGIGDVSSPAKKLMPEYQVVEARISACIEKAFNVEFSPLTHEIDRRITTDEMVRFMHGAEPDAPCGLGVGFYSLTSSAAESSFLHMYEMLSSHDSIRHLGVSQ